jgi:peptidoglycan/LPS O-acetylase OafA/YrhL
MPASRPDARLAGHLPTLDGWRGVAVLLVIAFHAFGYRFYQLGAAGVSIFFALSGLLICNRLLAEFNRSGRIDLRGFYVRRAFRILPPALLFLAVLAVATPTASDDLWSCVFFWRNYHLGGGWYTGHFWSLAVEEHFYMVFPVLLALAGPRRGLRLAAGLAAGLVAWRFFESRWPLPIERFRLVQPYFRTDCRLADLLFGALTALLAERTPARVRRLAAAAGGLVLAWALVSRSVPWLAVSVLMPWLLLDTVLRPHGRLGKMLEWPLLARLGRMSYSLYLWQQFFFLAGHAPLAGGLGSLQNWPWNVVGLLACAAASHRWLERPLTRLGRRLADRLASRPTALTVGELVGARAATAVAWRRNRVQPIPAPPTRAIVPGSGTPK